MTQESWKRLFPWQKNEGSSELRRLERRIPGERVVLRPKSIEDAEQDYRWRADPELADLDATAPIRLTLREYRRYYRDELEFPSPWSVRYAIDTQDGVHIGNTMYYDIDRTRAQAELGIMIGNRDYWGRGYGTDAVRTLLRSIFLEAGLEYVYLHTLTYNERAQGAFRRAGFKDVGTVRREGRTFLKMDARRDEWLAEFAPEETGTSSEEIGSDAEQNAAISRGEGSQGQG
ncbi:MAG: GNAT family N-acetyltransferase [Chloroflexota bacterium]